MMVLWLKVTADKYEFPIKIAETQKELAIMCGLSGHPSRGRSAKRGKKDTGAATSEWK